MSEIGWQSHPITVEDLKGSRKISCSLNMARVAPTDSLAVPEHVLEGKMRSGLRAITPQVLLVENELRAYLLGGRLLTARNGGVFVANRKVAPSSLRTFGIVLPQGGMILPQHAVEEVQEALKEASISERREESKVRDSFKRSQLEVAQQWAAEVGATAGIREVPWLQHSIVYIEVFSEGRKCFSKVLIGYEFPPDPEHFFSRESILTAVRALKEMDEDISKRKQDIEEFFNSLGDLRYRYSSGLDFFGNPEKDSEDPSRESRFKTREEYREYFDRVTTRIRNAAAPYREAMAELRERILAGESVRKVRFEWEESRYDEDGSPTVGRLVDVCFVGKDPVGSDLLGRVLQGLERPMPLITEMKRSHPGPLVYKYQ